MELVAPAEFIASLAECVVAYLRSRMPFGQVGGVGGNLVGDDSRAHIFAVRQSEVLFRSDITQHGGAQPTDLCGTDGGGNVVVSRGDVGH